MLGNRSDKLQTQERISRNKDKTLEITSYVIEENLHMTEETTTRPLSERISDGRLRWVDMLNPDADELRNLLRPLILDDSIIEEYILQERNLPVAHSENELYFEFPLISHNSDFEIEYVSFLCMPTLLITIHKKEVDVVSKLAGDLCESLHLQKATIASLLFNLLSDIVEKNYFLFMDQRKRITNLGNSVALEREPAAGFDHLLELKRNVERLNVMVEDQLYCVNTIQNFVGQAFNIGKQRRNFRHLEAEIRNGFRFLSRYERRLEDIHQHYDLIMQDKTNNRLKVLTIVAAIFLPLNLIAGIYGMNFESMPLLHWTYAYPATILLMLLLSGGMIYYFYRRGWFN